MSNNNSACQTPGGRSDSDENSFKGALLITPIALSVLEDLQCPICHELYTEPPTPNRLRGPDQEWAVRVDMIAEWFGTKRCCGHVIGRKCLEKHLKGPGAWRNKCPLCRDVWYHEVVPKDAQQPTRAHLRLSAAHTPRRSQRTAEQRSIDYRMSELSLSSRHGVAPAQPSRRQQRRPTSFTQRLLAALEVEEGSEEVKGTMEEVERRLDELYENNAARCS